MIDCSRPYASEYTIDTEEDIIVVADTIRFTETPNGDYVGEGQPDRDGDTMVLRLIRFGSRIVTGTWQEENRTTGETGGHGKVFFELNTDGVDGMIGEWNNGDTGSWSLTRLAEATPHLD
jgi:hypothetical protein